MKKTVFVLLILTALAIVLLLTGEKHITTEITINAPAEKVWAELTDFKSYPEWNPFIKKLEGSVKTGETIEVSFSHEGKSMEFTPKVLQYVENEIFQWEGKLIMPGIFTGRHTFRLEKTGNSTTRLIQEEDFSGILVPFFNFDSTIAGFKAMNSALKKRVENKGKAKEN